MLVAYSFDEPEYEHGLAWYYFSDKIKYRIDNTEKRLALVSGAGMYTVEELNEMLVKYNDEHMEEVDEFEFADPIEFWIDGFNKKFATMLCTKTPDYIYFKLGECIYDTIAERFCDFADFDSETVAFYNDGFNIIEETVGHCEALIYDNWDSRVPIHSGNKDYHDFAPYHILKTGLDQFVITYESKFSGSKDMVAFVDGVGLIDFLQDQCEGDHMHEHVAKYLKQADDIYMEGSR